MTLQPAPREFESLRDQVQAVMNFAVTGGGHFDPRLVLQSTATGLGASTPSEGGFLVSTQHALTIFEHANNVGQILRRTRKQPITTKAGKLRLPTVSETSRANGSRAGGFALAWLDEAETFPQSTLTFGEMNLIPKLLGGVVWLTNELMADSPAFDAWFPTAAGKEIATITEDAIINGTGSGQPLGILNSGALVSVTPESGQAAATLRAENCAKMAARLFSGCYDSPGTVWMCNNDVFQQLQNQRQVDGAPLVEFASGQRMCMGWPLIVCEHTAELGSEGDLILADLGEYVISERESGILGSIHLKFVQDETCLRIKTRIDGQPGWSSPVTPKSGSGQQSAFVTLQARE